VTQKKKRQPPDYTALGRKGGKASLRTMTPEERRRRARHAALSRHKLSTKQERSESARRAVLARWAKVKAAKP